MPIFFLAKILDLYVEILRNIPAVVKLFLIHFVLGFDAFMAGAIALSLHQSAYIADGIYAGLRSLPAGQLEAALLTGMSYRHAFTRVLVPQALRISHPPITTHVGHVVKDLTNVKFTPLAALPFVTNRINQIEYLERQ